jgi:hypothetical protein
MFRVSRVPQAVPTRAVVCAPCGIERCEGGREVVSGRVRMAGMTEKERRAEVDDGSALYQVRGKTLLHDDWLAKAASRVQARYDGEQMHGTGTGA